MEVYLDEQAIAVDTSPGRTLAQVIEAGRQAAADDERVIVSIQCDGVDLVGEQLDGQLTEPADRYQRVDLLSARAGQIVADALSQARTILDQADAERQRVADLLTRGETGEAVEVMSECFGGWAQVHRALAESIAFLGLDTAALQAGDRPLADMLGEIREQLTQIKEVLAVGDHVLLADILQYEFGETTERWRQGIDAVLAAAAGPAPA